MKFTWNEINNKISSTYDLLICSASYEERCHSFVKHCPAGNFLYTIVCYAKEYKAEISSNFEGLKKLLNEKKMNYETIEYSHKDPLKSTDTLMKNLEKIINERNVQTVVIDVTTFTHEMTLVLLWLFKEKFHKIDVTFTYSNAGNYNPGTRCPEDHGNIEKHKWLSKGIGEIRSVLGYPGTLLPAKSTHLIIIVGYEHDRALSIISEMEPSSLSLAFGETESATTITEKHRGAKESFDLIAKESLSFLQKEKILSLNISCNDLNKAKKQLGEHLENNENFIGDKNIIMFAMNNKISTLGVGLLAIERKNIQLCYAPALIYNYTDYSSLGNNCYLFSNIY